MDPDGKWTSTWAVLLAAAGQNRWPPAGSYMAATGQDLMAADTSSFGGVGSCGAFQGLKEITVGLALLSPIDLESLKSEVTGMTIVAPLYSDERSFFSDHEPGVFEVLRAGEFLGYVDADNEVTFPAARTVNPYPEGAASIQLEDLLDPPRTVNLTKIDGRLTRSDE